MTPRTHTKLMRWSPLVGVVAFFAGFAVLAAVGADLALFGVMAITSLILIVGPWAAVRWLVAVECPGCGSRLKLKRGAKTYLYECPRCSKVIDSGQKSAAEEGFPVAF